MLAATLLVAALAPPPLAVRAAEALRAGDVFVEPAFVSGDALCAARAAVRTLHARHASAAATAGASAVADSAVRSCDALDLLADGVWPTLPPALGAVVGALDSLRGELALATRRPLLDAAELQLLTYRAGGHYARHVDDGVGTAGRSVRRSISLLLYLTPDDWRDADGGQLRIHPAARGAGAEEHQPERSPPRAELRDVAPRAGSLVLFDSKVTPHEVLTTARERSVVVGWYLEARDG